MSNVETKSPVDERLDETKVELGVQSGPKPSGNNAGETNPQAGLLTRPKETAIDFAHDLLTGIEKKWKKLEAKTAAGSEKAKADFRKVKALMDATLRDVRQKIIQAKNANGDVLHDSVKIGLDEVLKKARNLYEDTAKIS